VEIRFHSFHDLDYCLYYNGRWCYQKLNTVFYYVIMKLCKQSSYFIQSLINYESVIRYRAIGKIVPISPNTVGTYLSFVIFLLRILIDLLEISIEFSSEKVIDFFLNWHKIVIWLLLLRHNLRKKFLLVIILTLTRDIQRTSIEWEFVG